MGRRRINTEEETSRLKKEYIKDNIKRYTLSLNVNTDIAIIRYLDGMNQYSVYIKDLIEKDMRRKGMKMSVEERRLDAIANIERVIQEDGLDNTVDEYVDAYSTAYHLKKDPINVWRHITKRGKQQ